MALLLGRVSFAIILLIGCNSALASSKSSGLDVESFKSLVLAQQEVRNSYFFERDPQPAAAAPIEGVHAVTWHVTGRAGAPGAFDVRAPKFLRTESGESIDVAVTQIRPTNYPLADFYSYVRDKNKYDRAELNIQGLMRHIALMGASSSTWCVAVTDVVHLDSVGPLDLEYEMRLLGLLHRGDCEESDHFNLTAETFPNRRMPFDIALIQCEADDICSRIDLFADIRNLYRVSVESVMDARPRGEERHHFFMWPLSHSVILLSNQAFINPGSEDALRLDAVYNPGIPFNGDPEVRFYLSEVPLLSAGGDGGSEVGNGMMKIPQGDNIPQRSNPEERSSSGPGRPAPDDHNLLADE